MGLSPYDQEQGATKKTRKKKEKQRKAKGHRGNKAGGEAGPLVALIMLAILPVVVVCFSVGILCVCGSSTWDTSTRAVEQTKVFFFSSS